MCVNHYNFDHKRLLLLIIALMLALLPAIAGCRRNTDKPPNPGTPLPAPHTGMLSSDYGTLTFIGDGKTVHVNLTDDYLEALENPPNDVDYEYVFTWYSFGSCRYDVATELKLYHIQSDTSINFSIEPNTTEDCITIMYPVPKETNVIFIKEAAPSGAASFIYDLMLETQNT